MDRYGPNINGYSRSVIIHMIEILKKSAEEERRIMAQTFAAKAFSKKEATLIRLLERWMGAKHTKEFKTMFDVYNFLADAERLLDILTPEE